MSKITVLMMISEFVRAKKHRNLKQVATNQCTIKTDKYKALASCCGRNRTYKVIGKHLGARNDDQLTKGYHNVMQLHALMWNWHTAGITSRSTNHLRYCLII